MGVNFDVTSFTKAKIFNPREVGYEDSVDIICEELRKTGQSFIKIGWYLKHIYEEKLYTKEGYSNIYECAQDKFHMSQGTTTRYINLCNEYSIGHDSPELDKKYVDYNISQLFEMLPMKEEQLEKVTPDMTVKQIRDIKNETTNGPDDGEIREFCRKYLSDISVNEKNNLKEYMILHYGECHAGGGDSDFDYQCGLRGIRINDSDEITWTQFVKRVKELEELIPGSCFKAKSGVSGEIVEADGDSDIPGQTSLEEDFPEYLPETEHVDSDFQKKEHATSHKKASKEKQEYVTSHKEPVEPADVSDDPKENMVIDSSCIENHDQPELPMLKNNDQRKEWLGNYKAWGLWYRDENIDVNYYKYDFPDGSRLIVAEYPQRHSYYSSGTQDEQFYHLLEKNKKGYEKAYDEKYRHQTDSETYLVEFLKEVQKKG